MSSERAADRFALFCVMIVLNSLDAASVVWDATEFDDIGAGIFPDRRLGRSVSGER
jgi:hypothetical protein